MDIVVSFPRCTPGCDGSEDPREPPSFFGNTFDAIIIDTLDIIIKTTTITAQFEIS